jgi:ATP-dependent helicase Lhr and Lhr-like helicase
MALEQFHPAVRAWFSAALGMPTPAQHRAWPAIAAGDNVPIAAPTGSGKTLAAMESLLRRQGRRANRLRPSSFAVS